MEDVLKRPTSASSGLIRLARVIYTLHGLSILIGITGVGTKLGAVMAAIPAVLAVVLNVMARAAAKGTFISSHFVWQLRTMWLVPVWIALIAATRLSTHDFSLVILGVPIALLGIAYAYRVGRGWLTLNDRRRMYEAYRVA